MTTMQNTDATRFDSLTVGAFHNFRTTNGDSHMGTFESYDAQRDELTVGWASSWYANANGPVWLDDDSVVLLKGTDVTEVFDDLGEFAC